MSATILITGAKSGIGYGLLAAYAARPNTTVIAAIRDAPDTAVAQSLKSLPVGSGSRVIAAQYDAASLTAAKDLVRYLQQKHSIAKLDVLVANAGILSHHGPPIELPADDLLDHFRINTLAPVLLYQAAAPLLNASTNTPKFFIISSTLGSNMLIKDRPSGTVAYGASKAAINFIAGHIHKDDEKIAVVPIHPGWVRTPMGEKAAGFWGMSKTEVPVTIDDSVNGLLKVFDATTKEEHSGKFWDYNFEIVPW